MAERLKSRVLAEPVLVGRERELEELESFLKSAADGKGKTVFISGEAGAGKTRLTTEFLKKAKKQGITTLTGWCLSNAAVPYFPFFEAFNAYFTEEQNKEKAYDIDVTSWLNGPDQTEKVGKTQAFSAQVWKDQTFAAVTRTLTVISTGKPIILFIDDIHWADSASLALIHYIARAIRSEKILLVSTFRSEELTADAEGRPHPLVETLRTMGREDLFTEIKLSNLSQTCVAKIAENLIGGTLQSDFAEKLAVESRGNPLFVVESLRMLSERKSLLQENNQWRLAVHELCIPSKIRDIILSRLAVLKYPQRRVLEAASVIGEKFEVGLLSRVLGQDVLEVLETLNVIAQSTSLVSAEENSYRFDHTRSRETIYEELSPPLKKGYHARIAEKLENLSKDKDRLPVSDLAYHYTEAENTPKAIQYSIAAGNDALERFSNTEAIKHFTYVLKTMPKDGDYNVRITAQEGLGDAFNYVSLGEATKAYEQLLSMADSEVVKLRALRKAMQIAYWQGNSKHSLDLAAQAEQFASADRLEYARVRLNKGVATNSAATANMMEARTVVSDIEISLHVFEEEFSLPDVAAALRELSILYPTVGCSEKAIAAGKRCAAIFEDLSNSRDLVAAHGYSGAAFFMSGLLNEGLLEEQKSIDLGRKLGDNFTTAWAHYECSLVYESKATGVLDELEKIRNRKQAIDQDLQGIKYAEKTDMPFLKFLLHGSLTRLYAQIGDIPHSEEFFSKLNSLFDMATKSGDNGLLAIGMRSKAALLAAKKTWKEANDSFQASLDLYKKAGSASSIFDIGVRADYAFALMQQGLGEKAKQIFEGVKKTQADRQRLTEGKFNHVNINADLVATEKIQLGDEIRMRLDLVNVAKVGGKLIWVEGLLPTEFKTVAINPLYDENDGKLKLNGKEIAPFECKTIELTARSTRTGIFDLNPQVIYLDEMGQTKSIAVAPVSIIVQARKSDFEILPGRITTGYIELDRLLLGGIPESYSIVLSAPSCNEREQIIRYFIESGVESNETTLYLTCDVANAKKLTEHLLTDLHSVICNPQAELVMPNAPNVFKLKSVENLTELDISLTKTFRAMNLSSDRPKRACIDLLSDVLLQHHSMITRKWLSSLLPSLKNKGFTTLAILDPNMHSAEDAQAIVGLFDGEIRISEKESAKGMEKVLRIRKLYNQKYLENELTLNKEAL